MTARLRPEDLPPAVRRQLGIPDPRRAKPRPSRADGAGQPCPGRCAGPLGCGTPFPTFSRWERHTEVSGCRGRWEIDLPQGANRAAV